MNWTVEHIRHEVADVLADLERFFVPGMRLAFIAIHPTNPDAHFVTASVGLDKIKAAIEETQRSREERDDA